MRSCMAELRLILQLEGVRASPEQDVLIQGELAELAGATPRLSQPPSRPVVNADICAICQARRPWKAFPGSDASPYSVA